MSERQKKKLAQREANRLKRRMIEKVLSTSRTSNVAFNLNLLLDGWLELESDPGTFSLLLEDFGCFGAQVDEIYDLEQKFEGPVFGFIFLFKWLNNQHNDRLRNQKSTSSSSANNTSNDRYKDPQQQQQHDQQSPEQGQWSYVEDENIISEIYFAKQMISNSCATHALISILLNCDYHELNLGPTLTRLKEHTKSVNPETKGYAIGNLPELAKAHNSHASYSSLYNRNKPSSHSSGMSFTISGNQRTNLQQQNKHEAYHFISYVPINNRLYELDGLKNYPIDHGPFGPKEDWTEKFKSVIKQRLLANKTGDDATISNDIRYSLMAVVPDKRVCLRAQLKKLKSHLGIVNDGIKRLTERVSVPLSIDVDIPNPPYSPLSNGTLTASEAGSVYNSPTNLGECFFSDDDECGVDKYFFVRFDEQADTSQAKGENLEPAHQNCIVQIEPTSVRPLDMAIAPVIGDQKSSGAEIQPDGATSDHDENLIKGKTLSSDVNENSESKTTEETDQAKFTCNARKKSPLAQEAQVSAAGVASDDVQANEAPAHNNEKYNLSAKPPFDFNILDEMQHVHIGKSTLKDMKTLSRRLQTEINTIESLLKEEVDKRRKYKIDNSRRTHNYEPFIMTFLGMLAKQGKLADLIEKDLGLIPDEVAPPAQVSDSTIKTQRHTIYNTGNKISTTNGGSINKTNPHTPKANLGAKPKPKYKYVSTGRPVGRPRKNPLMPSPVKATPNSK